MPPGYGPPGMPPFQPVAMPTGQPMGYPGSMPGIPASYPPQLTQQNIAQTVTAAFQPIPNTGSPVVMSKELNIDILCVVLLPLIKLRFDSFLTSFLRLSFESSENPVYLYNILD